MKINHWMTFGTFSEQNYFVYPSENSYDGVIFNGNMASYAPGGLAAFLLEKTAGIKYIIDPFTHAFQHNVQHVLVENKKSSTKEVKSSVKKLAECLGEPFSTFVGNTPLRAKHFDTEEVMKNVLRNCFNFQSSQLSSLMKCSEVAKYMGDELEEQLSPYALILPYFYMQETNIEEWLRLQIKFVDLSLKLRNGSKVFAAIVIDKGILQSDNLIEKILNEYSNKELDGFLLWIDDFDEQKAKQLELKNFLKLACGLRKESREVINLHGGYFSILAAGNMGGGALTGVAHGPEYGESRAVVPVGGGIPVPKFYIRQLHKRTAFKEALSLFQDKKWLDSCEKYYNNVCDCRKCKEIIGDDVENFVEFGKSITKTIERADGTITRRDFRTPSTKDNCLLHYLEVKCIEYKTSGELPRDLLLKDLQNGIAEFEDLASESDVYHLKNWIHAFEEFSV